MVRRNYYLTDLVRVYRFLVENYADQMRWLIVKQTKKYKFSIVHFSNISNVIANPTTNEVVLKMFFYRYKELFKVFVEVIIDSILCLNMEWLYNEIQTGEYEDWKYDELFLIWKTAHLIRLQYAQSVGLSSYNELKTYCETAGEGGFHKVIYFVEEEDTCRIAFYLKIHEF